MQPLISVVMSVYNGEKYLKYSILSILNQSYPDFEFIIINDGSTDSTNDILKKIETLDKRLKIYNQDNIGLTKSLNKAVSLSRGTYIARQDVDDISCPNRLQKQYDFINENPGLELVASWYSIIDDKGEELLKRRLHSAEFIRKYFKYENFIVHTSVLFTKTAFTTYGGYDESLKYGQDKFLWMKMKRLGIVPDYLVKYRWHSTNITHTKFIENVSPKSEDTFVREQILRYVSSVLIQQNDLVKARALLMTHLLNPRHFFYFLFSFMPSPVRDFFFYNLRYKVKLVLGKFITYYKIGVH